MRVCFISHSSKPGGGAELSLLDLVDALKARDVECCCILRKPDHGMKSLLERRGVETLVVSFKWWMHTRRGLYHTVRRSLPTYQALSIARLAFAIRRLGCDIVYTNSITVGAGAIASKFLGNPHILHIREFGDDDFDLEYDWGRKRTRKLIGKLSAACIANSQAVADEFRPDIRDIDVVYNSVSIPDEAAAADDAPWRVPGALRCILLGKVTPGKGQQEAINAFARLAESNVPAELLIMGPALGAHGSLISEMINNHGLNDRVHVRGSTPNPIPYLNSADVLLMCSRREAFGRVTVEAMKLGKPVIGSRSGGTPEILDSGRTGLLYPPGDAQELADKIQYLYEHPSERQHMGENARLYAMRYNSDELGDNVLKILQRVMRERSQAAASNSVQTVSHSVTGEENRVA